MKKNNLQHLFHYLLLLLLMLAGVIALMVTGGQHLSQAIIIVGLGVSYFLWGIFHHLSEKSLHSEIILEYLLFAILGTATVLAVLYYL